MKRMLSLLLAALLMLAPVLSASAEAEAAPDSLPAWGFLADWGVLTQEETAMLSADRLSVENGRELVRTMTVETGALNGEKHSDQLLAEFAARMTIVSRSRTDGEALEVLLDGEPWLSGALCARDGGLVLDSSLLPGAVSFMPEELMQPGMLMRLTGAMQSNGLISRDDARVMNALLLGGGLPWPMSLMKTAPSLADFDLSAWNVVFEGIEARKTYVNIPGGGMNPDAQPAGCDPAAQVWTMEVTPGDVRDMIVAALVVVRDNPVLGDQLAALVGFDQTQNQAGRKVTFNDAFINPLLKELEGAEQLMPVGFRLKGYENDVGETVRLQVEILNMEADDGEAPAGSDSALQEPEVALMLLYNRVTTGNQVTHEVLFGDDKLEAYASLDVTEPHGVYARTYDLTLGAVAEDGQRTEHFRALLTAVTNRGAGLTEAQVQLSLLNPLFTAEERMVYDQQDVNLHLSIVRGGVMERYPEDCVMIIANYDRRIGAEQKAYVRYYVNYAMEGSDLKGTEQLTVTGEEGVLLRAESQVASRAPQGSLCREDAASLTGMSNQELNSLFAAAKDHVDELFGGVYEWTMNRSAMLPVTGEVTVTDEATARQWRIGVVEGDAVVRLEETTDDYGAGVTLERADGTQARIAFTGVQEGSATVRMITTDLQTGVVLELEYFDLGVDGQLNVRVLTHTHVLRMNDEP